MTDWILYSYQFYDVIIDCLYCFTHVYVYRLWSGLCVVKYMADVYRGICIPYTGGGEGDGMILGGYRDAMMIYTVVLSAALCVVIPINL